MVERVVIVSTEAQGYAMVGGLAVFTTGLAKYLRKAGIDARIICPSYREPYSPEMLNEELLKGAKEVSKGLSKTEMGDIPVYPLRTDMALAAYGCYTGASDMSTLYEYDASTDPRSFGDTLLFASHVIDALKKIEEAEDWKPDIVHLNDWPTAFAAPGLQKAEVPVLYTIHNGRYIGRVPSSIGVETRSRISSSDYRYPDEIKSRILAGMGPCIRIGDDIFLSLSEVGINYADGLNTVSQTYAQELLDAEKHEIDNRSRRLLEQQGGLHGILNGIDGEVMNPRTDELLMMQYDPSDISSVAFGKAVNKTYLQRAFGLRNEEVLLVSMIGRLAEQKGIQEVLRALDELTKMKGVQLLVAGQSDDYEIKKALSYRQFPEHISVVDKFIGPRLQHLIYAGSDAILMPSKYEPCGYPQMEGMAFGAFPIATAVGGLKDTVQQFDGEHGNGIVMQECSVVAIVRGIQEAKKLHSARDGRHRIVANALASDFRWDRPNDPSVAKYIALYDQLIAGKKANS